MMGVIAEMYCKLFSSFSPSILCVCVGGGGGGGGGFGPQFKKWVNPILGVLAYSLI